MTSFAGCRDPATYAIYAIADPLPVTVHWPSGSQTLRIARYPYPPHLTLEFAGAGQAAGCVYELESVAHGAAIVRHGLKVTVPGALDRFCARLVRDGRASVVAGPHHDLPWAAHLERQLDLRHPATCLDAFWTWRRFLSAESADARQPLSNVQS